MLRPIAEVAHRHAIQVIRTLCHLGCPDELDSFSPVFIERIANYCAATVR